MKWTPKALGMLFGCEGLAGMSPYPLRELSEAAFQLTLQVS